VFGKLIPVLEAPVQKAVAVEHPGGNWLYDLEYNTKNSTTRSLFKLIKKY